MLRLFEGGFASESRDQMLAELKAAVVRGERCFLFVPEQQTLVTEGEMCELLPASAPLCFEVTNFTRFINTAARALGGLGKGYCHGAESALIMWRAITELAPALTVTGGRSKVSFGVVSRILTAVKDLQSRGITPEDLSRAGTAKIDDRRLGDKLNDIALIYALYKKLLGESYSDVNDDMLTLADTLAENPEFLLGAKIYVDGFTSFTEPQYRLLSQMMRHSTLTVCLPLPHAGKDLFEYSEVKKARGRLSAIADRLGCEKRLYHADSTLSSCAPAIAETCRLLWRREGELDNDCLQNLTEVGGRVRIFEAGTVFDECDFLASDIRRRVTLGEKYSDFAIIARHADSYTGILDVALTRAGIPHFISARQSIMGMEAIKLISTAYAIAQRGFAREDVITYVKCGLSGLSREERDELELYCETWQIEGKRFTDPDGWCMNPDGYNEKNERSLSRLARINKSRERVIPPLESFAEDVRLAGTVKEHAEALYSFLDKIELESSLYKRAKDLYELGERAAAEENARLWEIICSALDTVVSLLGDTPADAESFISQMNVIFSETSIGRIPAFTDTVTVGSADMLRTGGKRHVYLIGVNTGEFPAAVSDGSYFSEREKAKLSDLGLSMEPDLEIRSARERYSFSRAFSFARETVTLMYASRSTSGNVLSPDEVIKRIDSITKGTVTPKKVKNIPLLDRIYSVPDALLLSGDATAEEYGVISSALAGAECGEVLKVKDGSIRNDALSLSEGTIGLLYKEELYLSQTKLEKFLACPFSYFCNYGLRLSKLEIAELNSRVIGSFVHSILENFFKMLKDTAAIDKLGADERDDMARRAAESYISTVLGEGGSAKNLMVINRLRRASRPVIDALCDEFANCRFTPVFFELPIGGADESTPKSVVYTTRDGGKAIIGGVVDRVDSFKSGEDVYVRVLDYKTGAKAFSPTDLKEGENLQMFLYMKAIADTDSPAFKERLGVGEGGRIIPAGVLYVSTSVKDTTVKTASDELAEAAARELYTRQGMLLDDPANLEANNPLYMPKNRERDVDFKYTEEGWSALTHDIEEAVLDIVDNMKGGDITASPKKPRPGSSSPCDYCEYKPVCRSAMPSGRRR